MSKYPRTFHAHFSPGATNDDRIADNMLRLIGVPIVILEKMDGENCGMITEGVYARSHAAFTISPWSREVRELHARIGHQIPEGVHIFGENMEGIHSIEYEKLRSYFYVFGVREEMNWLSWIEVEEYAFFFDLVTVPVLFKGTVTSEKELQALVEKLAKEPSALGGEREGVVFRTQAGFPDTNFGECVLKWVRSNHVTTPDHWTKTWKRAKLYSNAK